MRRAFADYRAAGVNRVSLGVQALNDADLKTLGRLHDVAEAKARAEAGDGDISTAVSLDLIYARPDQSDAAMARGIERGAGLRHRSSVALSAHHRAGDALRPAAQKRRSCRFPDEDLAAELYETTQELTEAAGLPAYEISNHARPGAESRHNLIYWRYGDYAGVGPGAHGRLDLNGKRIATSPRSNCRNAGARRFRAKATALPR